MVSPGLCEYLRRLCGVTRAMFSVSEGCVVSPVLCGASQEAVLCHQCCVGHLRKLCCVTRAMCSVSEGCVVSPGLFGASQDCCVVSPASREVVWGLAGEGSWMMSRCLATGFNPSLDIFQEPGPHCSLQN